MKTALVLGGSGLVGGYLIELLCKDERYQMVKSVGRAALSVKHAKLVHHVIDMQQLDDHAALFADVDDVFIAIGTTRAKTPNKADYRAIDLDIPVTAGTLAKKMGVKQVAVVSSMGANAKSAFFYPSLKGEMELAMQAINLHHLVIVRPSLLVGKRKEMRVAEKIVMVLMQQLQFIIPKRHKAIPAKTVAQAMITLLNQLHQQTIWQNDALLALERDQ